MSESFGLAALRLAGLAARHLGWRPHEFWTATPSELAVTIAPPEAATPLARGEFTRMMEQDDAGI